MTGEKSGSEAEDLRGLGKLAVDATLGITDLIEALHHNISGRSGAMPTRQDGRAGGIAGKVYDAVRGATRVTGLGIDAALGLLAPRLAGLGDRLEREHIQSALNGVLGDHLEASRNPLAIPMAIRVDGRTLALTRAALTDALPQATGRILLLVHGLCMNDRQWRRTRADGTTHDHGMALQREAGFMSVYLHYNSGRHIAENGAALDALLQDLVREWPVPVEEIAVLAHSMGGLVARSAFHQAGRGNQAWTGLARKMIFLGTPHRGAPLERGGHWFDMLLGTTPFAAPFAAIGKIRSKGITDLRHGSITGKHNEHVALPADVACFALAGSLLVGKSAAAEALLGDGLVPVASALGQHPDPSRRLAFAEPDMFRFDGVGHMQLLADETVYARLHEILACKTPPAD